MPRPPDRTGRRGLLGRLGTVGSIVLAGCIGGGPSEGTATPPVSAARTAVPSSTPTPTPTPSTTVTTTPTPTPVAAVTVDVGPDRSLRFDPRSFTVGVGDPVAWVFRSLGHNVKPEAIPAESDWSGTPGDDFETLPTGFVHRYAFSVPGEYEYVCVPHRSSGMVGSFTVEG